MPHTRAPSLLVPIHCPRLMASPEAGLEVGLVALAVGEAGAGGLGPADAAALQAAVHLGLVEAEHLGQEHRAAQRATEDLPQS